MARQQKSALLLGLGQFVLGHAYLGKGAYEDALEQYQVVQEYANTAEDKIFVVRAPNCLGGVYLDLYDLPEAIRLNAENVELARRLWPWSEPLGNALVKLGLAYLYREHHGLAQQTFQQALDLPQEDTWGRWIWEVSLLQALGELALLERRHGEAWTYATQALALATPSDYRKKMIRAQRLQGDILAAQGQLEEAVRLLDASVQSAEALQTAREIWLGKAALGRVLARLGRDNEAEQQFTQAIDTIAAIVENLRTPRLRQSFRSARPVVDIYETLGYRPPTVDP